MMPRLVMVLLILSIKLDNSPVYYLSLESGTGCKPVFVNEVEVPALVYLYGISVPKSFKEDPSKPHGS